MAPVTRPARPSGPSERVREGMQSEGIAVLKFSIPCPFWRITKFAFSLKVILARTC